MNGGKPLLIKNGTVVNADSTGLSDVLVANGKIVDVGRDIACPSDCDVVDAKGKYVLPGGIDPNTRLEVDCGGMRPKDDFYSGTRAGVAGGTTMVIDLVMPKKGESPLGAYLEWRGKADKKAVCDYSLHVGITWWGPQVSQDMEVLVSKYGVSSFKMFMAGDFMMDDAELYHAFRKCAEIGAIPMVHAENGLIIKENIADLLSRGVTSPEGHNLSRSENVEAEAANRACVIAENVGSSLYVSPVTSQGAAAMVALWRQAGNTSIHAEALAASLGAPQPSPNDYERISALVTSPPVRFSHGTSTGLMMRLAEGNIAAVASHNCTFDKSQKEVGRNNFSLIPNGLNGLEDRMSIVWTKGVETGILSAQQFVAVTSSNAATIFKLFPKKGCIAPGSDADIVVWDGRNERVVSSTTDHHSNDVNVFEGVKIRGTVSQVIVKGRMCYANNELSTVKGWGEFVPMSSSSPATRTTCCSPVPNTPVPMPSSLTSAAVVPQTPNSPSELSTPNSPSAHQMGDRAGHGNVTEFVEPKSLNFQEKRCAIEAMKKICTKVNLTLAVVFKNSDKGDTNEVSKTEFQIILSKVCGVSALSNREIEAIAKGYGTGDSVKYTDFLRACEYLFAAKKQGKW